MYLKLTRSVDSGARSNIQRFAVFISKGQIGRDLRDGNGIEMFTQWIKNPYPGRAGGIQIAVLPDLHTVRDSRFREREYNLSP